MTLDTFERVSRHLIPFLGTGPYLSFGGEERIVKSLNRNGAKQAFRIDAFKTPSKRLFKLNIPDAFAEVVLIGRGFPGEIEVVFPELIRVAGKFVVLLPAFTYDRLNDRVKPILDRSSLRVSPVLSAGLTGPVIDEHKEVILVYGTAACVSENPMLFSD